MSRLPRVAWPRLPGCHAMRGRLPPILTSVTHPLRTTGSSGGKITRSDSSRGPRRTHKVFSISRFGNAGFPAKRKPFGRVASSNLRLPFPMVGAFLPSSPGTSSEVFLLTGLAHVEYPTKPPKCKFCSPCSGSR